MSLSQQKKGILVNCLYCFHYAKRRRVRGAPEKGSRAAGLGGIDALLSRFSLNSVTTAR